jgi:cytochrome c oxidase subunit 2
VTLPVFTFALGLAAHLLGCGGIPSAEVPVDAVAIRVRAQDTAWSASLVLAWPAGGTREVSVGREVHLPLGAEVELSLESRDYICVFAMPGLGLRDFAAPGLASRFHFRAAASGSYEFRGDELCGRPHTEKTRGRFIIESPAAFQEWVHQQSKKAFR